MANPIFEKIKEYTLPILLTFGSFLLVLYYIIKYLAQPFFITHQNGFKEIFSFSLMILGSGIFLAVLKWFQFMGFFKTGINQIINSSDFESKLQTSFKDVLYSDDFLKKQNDIENIWKRVTRCYFKSELPDEISDKVNTKLSEVFFHNNKFSHFFRNYIITVNVHLDTNGYLTIQEIAEVKIIRQNVSEFNYDFTYFIEKNNTDDITSKIDIELVKVEGDPIDLRNLVKENNKDLVLSKKAEIQLKGKNEYNIISRITLIYNLEKDNEYEFLCERIIDNIRVEVKCSPNVKAKFLPIGNDNYIDGELNNQDNYVKTFNDILLPEKGFRLIFDKR